MYGINKLIKENKTYIIVRCERSQRFSQNFKFSRDAFRSSYTRQGIITYRNNKLHRGSIWGTSDSFISLQKILNSVERNLAFCAAIPSSIKIDFLKSLKKVRVKEVFRKPLRKRDKSDLTFRPIRFCEELNIIQCRKYEY